MRPTAEPRVLDWIARCIAEAEREHTDEELAAAEDALARAVEGLA